MPRILVVEDEAPLQLVQKRILSRLGAEVLLAASVEEARRIIETTELDLVISDVRMPGGLSGVDLLRWIEAEHPRLAARFLLVTGDVTDAEIAEIARSQTDRVIHKPFMMQEYLACVNRILADTRDQEGALT
jgi:DNA-binding NtrC family response regulator